MKKAVKTEQTEIIIKAPNFMVLECTIVGTAPFASNNFSRETEDQMKVVQEAGEAGKAGKKKREPKDFEAGYEGSMHTSEEGWHGINATTIRSAMIRACSMVEVEMTRAKQLFFVLADGYEPGRATPLVKITKGKPERFDSYVRNANGSADIRARARWAVGWEAKLRIRYDADMFKQEMVANLIQRAMRGAKLS